jgi:hypothetical protein
MRCKAKGLSLYRMIEVGKWLFVGVVSETCASFYTEFITLHPVRHFVGGSDKVSSF